MDSAIIELNNIYHDLGVKHFRGKINLKLFFFQDAWESEFFFQLKGEM